MFHLKYTRFQGFCTWDELGCLSRSLGFPVDLFSSHVTDEIHVEENGLVHKELYKMLDYNLLFKALHTTINHHTADWNTCVIRRAVSLLDLRAVMFEDLYNVRIAYQAYEAGDMKGLIINQHVILRCLKMCGKMISPMKLMHRLKHSKDQFDEKGRIQLYEFLDLIIWCDIYQQYEAVDQTAPDMENELFKLTEFETLLSHHDQRLATSLDTQYLKEEWDFGQEKLSNRSKFSEPPVICGEARVELVRSQKENFRQLRSAVSSSQDTVYRVRSGFIRPRPLTAPNLGQYVHQSGSRMEQGSVRSLKSLKDKRASLIRMVSKTDMVNGIEKSAVDMSNKPVMENKKRCQTAKVLSRSELEEADQKIQELLFHIETERGRSAIKLESEIDFYIPKYKDKWQEKQNQESISVPVLKKKKTTPKAPSVPPEEIAHSLAYPERRIPPSHAKSCDARFRGWYDVRSKKGPHYILASKFYSDSTNSKVQSDMSKKYSSEIRKVHGDLLYRYTKKAQVDKRPVTAPVAVTDSNTGQSGSANLPPKPLTGFMIREEEQLESSSSSGSPEPVPVMSREVAGSPEPAFPDPKSAWHSPPAREDTELEVQDSLPQDRVGEEASAIRLSDNMDRGHEKRSSPMAEEGEEERDRPWAGDAPSPGQRSKIRSHSARLRGEGDTRGQGDGILNDTEIEEKPRSRSAACMATGGAVVRQQELSPMPPMKHSKPRTVLVGSIGQISLLENIREAGDWEDVDKRKLSQNGSCKQFPVEAEYSSSEDSSSVESDITGETKTRSSSRRKHRRPKSKASDNAILGMILKEDKHRRKKDRKYADNSWSSVKSGRTSSCSQKSSSSSRGVKSRGNKAANRTESSLSEVPSPKVTPASPEVPADKEDQTGTPDKSGTSLTPVAYEDSEPVEGRKSSSSKKYQRLFQRMGGEMSERLSRRLQPVATPSRMK